MDALQELKGCSYQQAIDLLAADVASGEDRFRGISTYSLVEDVFYGRYQEKEPRYLATLRVSLEDCGGMPDYEVMQRFLPDWLSEERYGQIDDATQSDSSAIQIESHECDALEVALALQGMSDGELLMGFTGPPSKPPMARCFGSSIGSGMEERNSTGRDLTVTAMTGSASAQSRTYPKSWLAHGFLENRKYQTLFYVIRI